MVFGVEGLGIIAQLASSIPVQTYNAHAGDDLFAAWIGYTNAGHASMQHECNILRQIVDTFQQHYILEH